MNINTIYNEDCLVTMSKMPDNSINGIITSPPYNITVSRNDVYYDNGYSDMDNLNEKDYLSLRLKEFKEFSRILKDDGVICYNISYCTNNPVLPILLISSIHNETDLTIVDIISWKKSTSLPFQSSSTRLSRIVELIYIIVKKNSLNTFKTNKKISKINDITKQVFYKNYTNFIEAPNNDKFICELKASYSKNLCNQLINIYFPNESLIYDPFTGIGTTQLSCIENNCNYIGSEINKNFFEIAINRLKQSRPIILF